VTVLANTWLKWTVPNLHLYLSYYHTVASCCMCRTCHTIIQLQAAACTEPVILSYSCKLLHVQNLSYYHTVASCCMYRTCRYCQIVTKLECPRESFDNTQIWEFVKVPTVGAELFHADGQTYIAKLTVTFRNLAIAPKMNYKPSQSRMTQISNSNLLFM